MLVEETFHLGLIHLAHGGGTHGDFVAVLVRAGCGERIDGGQGGVVRVEDAELREVLGGDGPGGVMGEALVALEDGQRELMGVALGEGRCLGA